MKRLMAGLVLTAAGFISSAALAELSTEQLPDDLRATISANTEMVSAELSELAGFGLAPNEASVEWVDGFIQRNRGDDPEVLIDILGSFFGDAIIAKYGGDWVLYEGGPAVAIQEDFLLFPFSNVAKQFENGEEDSVLFLFRTIDTLLAEHRNE